MLRHITVCGRKIQGKRILEYQYIAIDYRAKHGPFAVSAANRVGRSGASVKGNAAYFAPEKKPSAERKEQPPPAVPGRGTGSGGGKKRPRPLTGRGLMIGDQATC
jgi:hypothetical protein